MSLKSHVTSQPNIYIGCDHRRYQIKKIIKDYFENIKDVSR